MISMAEQLNPIIISEYVHKEVLDKSTVLERLDKVYFLIQEDWIQ